MNQKYDGITTSPDNDLELVERVKKQLTRTTEKRWGQHPPIELSSYSGSDEIFEDFFIGRHSTDSIKGEKIRKEGFKLRNPNDNEYGIYFHEIDYHCPERDNGYASKHVYRILQGILNELITQTKLITRDYSADKLNDMIDEINSDKDQTNRSYSRLWHLPYDLIKKVKGTTFEVLIPKSKVKNCANGKIDENGNFRGYEIMIGQNLSPEHILHSYDYEVDLDKNTSPFTIKETISLISKIMYINGNMSKSDAVKKVDKHMGEAVIPLCRLGDEIFNKLTKSEGKNFSFEQPPWSKVPKFVRNIEEFKKIYEKESKWLKEELYSDNLRFFLTRE